MSALSNTAVPKYYEAFRKAVLRGDIPVCETIALEMNRIDALIENPGVYYDDQVVDGWVDFCEEELTLTDGSDLYLLDTFKLWGEQVYGWYYFVEKEIYIPKTEGIVSQLRPQITAIPPPINSNEKEPVEPNTQSSGATNFGSFFIKAPDLVPTFPPI